MRSIFSFWPYALGGLSNIIGHGGMAAGQASGLMGSQNVFLRSIGNMGNAFRTVYNVATGAIKTGMKGITKSINGLTGDISTGIQKELTGKIQDGLKVLYDSTFANVLSVSGNPVAAHLAGVAAQKSMVGPVGAIQKDLECMVGNVAGGLAATTEKMLRSMMDLSLIHI